jgi:hypothetical protein
MEKTERDQFVPPIIEPENIQGWEIERTVGPGPLGRNTAVAIGRKNGSTIQATASSRSMANEMLMDMILKREKA